jgi:hypothetical protein
MKDLVKAFGSHHGGINSMADFEDYQSFYTTITRREQRFHNISVDTRLNIIEEPHFACVRSRSNLSLEGIPEGYKAAHTQNANFS